MNSIASYCISAAPASVDWLTVLCKLLHGCVAIVDEGIGSSDGFWRSVLFLKANFSEKIKINAKLTQKKLIHKSNMAKSLKHEDC